MLLALWIGACVVISLSLANRPQFLVLTVVALRVAVPSVATPMLVGEAAGSIHPATWLTVVGLIVVTARRPRQVGDALSRNMGLVLVFAFIATGTILVTQDLRPIASVVSYGNTFVAGVLLFVLIRIVVYSKADALRVIVLGIIWIAIAQSLLALLQTISGSALLYESYRLSYYWFDPTAFSRPFGTLDSPLDLSLLGVIAVPFCVQIRRAIPQLAAVLAVFAGIALSQSRTGIILGVVGLLYLVVRSDMSIGRRLAVGLSLSAVTAVAVLVPNPIAQGLQDRIADDRGSAHARDITAQFFFDNLLAVPAIGNGSGASNLLKVTGQTGTSLENAYFIWWWDYGPIITLAIGCVVASIILNAIRSGSPRGVVAAALLAIVAAATYSGVSTLSAASILYFTALGLCVPFSRMADKHPGPSSAVGDMAPRARMTKSMIS